MSKTVKQLLAEHAAELIPSEGDKAWSQYRGRKFVGILRPIPNRTDFPASALLEPENPLEKWGYHQETRGIYVGYDEPIKWDAEAGMFHAPASHD